MDFIFMLTEDDRTRPDSHALLDAAEGIGLRHIGFKDIGLPPDELAALNRRIKAMGATSYLEVVSLDPVEGRRAARLAVEIGVDVLLGGTDFAGMAAETAGTATTFMPFAGLPDGHPTQLLGDAERIAEDCRRAEAEGCAGVDLLAYRAVDAPPLELIAAARAALRGRLVVAGSIDSPERIRAIAAAGADAFTIGTALLQDRFAPGRAGLRYQLAAARDACAACGRAVL